MWWNIVTQVGTALTLAAFIIAAVVTILRHRLQAREAQLRAAPAEQRGALAQALNDTFLIPSLPVDPNTLPDDKKYSLLLEQIADRSRRFYVTTVSVIMFAILAASVTVLALLRQTTGTTDQDVEQTLEKIADVPAAEPFERRVSVAELTMDVPNDKRVVYTRLFAREKGSEAWRDCTLSDDGGYDCDLGWARYKGFCTVTPTSTGKKLTWLFENANTNRPREAKAVVVYQ